MIKRRDIEMMANEVLEIKDNWDIEDLDTYAVVDLLMSIERKYDIAFDVDEWEQLNSLDDLVNLLNSKLELS